MKIEKITYQKTYSIGPYLTDRVGFEASITPPSLDNLTLETPEYVLSQLSKMADEWHRKTHPHLYQEERNAVSVQHVGYTPPASTLTTTSTPVFQVEKTDDEKQHVKANILSSVSIESLAQWKMLAGKHNLATEYMNRLKELTNEKV